jgi:hypothetical protein
VTQRGVSYLEALVALAVVAVIAATMVVPAYRSYLHSRAPRDAATTLAEDLGLLERVARNGTRDEGASLIIVSADPLVYRCYRGRPIGVDPASSLRALLVERRFPDVALGAGPISPATPLLYASNGSAQYVDGGTIADQHSTVAFSLRQRPRGTTAAVSVDLFTGAVSLP